MSLISDRTAQRFADGADEPTPARGSWSFVRGHDGPGGFMRPRRTVRLRLTALYGALFLVSGAVLLTITYLLVEGVPLSGPPNYRPPAVSGNIPLAIAVERHVVLHALLVRSGIALAAMGVASVWLGWIVAGRVLAPLRVITAQTRQISAENLHERLALAGPNDEIKDVSDTIDGLLVRLDAAFQAQRRFVANVSHELRTPLAMMRTSLDVAAAKPRPMSQDARVLSGKLEEGLEQAERLVESFLVLARAQAGGMDDLETVSLPRLVRAALAARTNVIDELNLTLRERLEPAQVTGSEMLLGRLIANLVDNAVLHNRPTGLLGVAIEADGPTTRLSVESDGRIVSANDVSRLVEPFQRFGADRTGSDSGGGVGLGLAIVAAIATAHGGVLALDARPEGGLTAVVDLPRHHAAARHGAPA